MGGGAWVLRGIQVGNEPGGRQHFTAKSIILINIVVGCPKHLKKPHMAWEGYGRGRFKSLCGT